MSEMFCLWHAFFILEVQILTEENYSQYIQAFLNVYGGTASDIQTMIIDGGITQSKLDSDLEAKIVNGYAETVGDGTATTFTITHNLGSTDVMVNVYKVDTGECVTCNVARTSTNAISVGAFPAPASNNLRILVQKIITA